MTMRTILDLVARYGTTSRTIRYYEQMGLVTPYRRGCERLYDRDQVVRLDQVMEWRRVGVPVADIQRILMDGEDETTVLRTRLRAIAAEHAKLDAQEADLKRQLHARFAEADAA